MENKKYEFTGETKIYNGRELKRIKRLSDGLIGGWIEKEENLSHEGNCFIFDDAIVCDNARVCNDARIYDNAMVCGDAKICNNAMIYGNARIHGDARIYGDTWIYGNAEVYDNAMVYGNASIHGDAEIYGHAKIYGNAMLYGNARICGNIELFTGFIQTKCNKIETYKSNDTRLITALLTETGWRFNIGCQELLTKEEFINRIHNTDGGLEENPHREFYLRVLNIY